MNNSKINHRERILGGLWGSVVGDALGVPVEFKDRLTVQRDPVTTMRGYGTHHQPVGTWSDDSSLLLSTVESLIQHEFDTADMGERFVQWYHQGRWTPHGKVFDVGIATAEALRRITQGVRAETAGGENEGSNGNGSLMRILPVALRFAGDPIKRALDHVHRASAITHQHRRSQLACGFSTMFVRQLLRGADALKAYQACLVDVCEIYKSDPKWAAELKHFELLLGGALHSTPEDQISSGGYVVDTLGASVWCLLTTNSFEECVLKAVNLGSDTDTTGCVAGGFAGVYYGEGKVRTDWIEMLSRSNEIRALFERFVGLCTESTNV